MFKTICNQRVGIRFKRLLNNDCIYFTYKNTFSTFKDYKQYDPSQVSLFDEKLIIVDHKDIKIAEDTKLNLHLKSLNNQNPHRAFSLLLFDYDCRFILQRRSEKKVTFPNLWSNSCCSHPLAGIEEDGIHGVKQAIIRRTKYELNIDIDYNDLLYVDKFLYRADSDSKFEEFESKDIFFNYSGLRSTRNISTEP